MKPRALLVTGTDTGVGKTVVSRGILRACRRRGEEIAPLKLVETGCREVEGELYPEDGVRLARAAGSEDLSTDLQRIVPFRFALPASPTMAAAHVGRELTHSDAMEAVERAFLYCPRLLIEGAGGALVPITKDFDFADLAQELGSEVIVVARDALGTLNHSLLTLEALRRRGITVRALVLNATSPEPSPLDHRAEMLRLQPRLEVWGPLPWIPNGSDDDFADALEAAGLEVSTLLAGA
ncbi:MAG: dethiobiotin synthase [Polyangiaceae bacterium]